MRSYNSHVLSFSSSIPLCTNCEYFFLYWFSFSTFARTQFLLIASRKFVLRYSARIWIPSRNKIRKTDCFFYLAICLFLSMVGFFTFLLQLLENDSGGSYFVWMRWGRVGYSGQSSLTSFGGNLDRAKSVFGKKFKDKTLNDWADRELFEKVITSCRLRIDFHRNKRFVFSVYISSCFI